MSQMGFGCVCLVVEAPDVSCLVVESEPCAPGLCDSWAGKREPGAFMDGEVWVYFHTNAVCQGLEGHGELGPCDRAVRVSYVRGGGYCFEGSAAFSVSGRLGGVLV